VSAAVTLPGRELLLLGAVAPADPALRRIQARAVDLRAQLRAAAEANLTTIGDGYCPVCVCCLEGVHYLDSSALLAPTEPRLGELEAHVAATSGCAFGLRLHGHEVQFAAVAVVCVECVEQFTELHAYGPDLFPPDTHGPYGPVDPEDF